MSVGKGKLVHGEHVPGECQDGPSQGSQMPAAVDHIRLKAVTSRSAGLLHSVSEGPCEYSTGQYLAIHSFYLSATCYLILYICSIHI